ncbi:hypothetical protein HD554DRAFT_2021404 [Boletus coccyginus]|nr:hypothetical protein HD554DRAFT_2021404 [Boletus coccyginus]
MPSKRSHSSAFHRNGSSNGSVSSNQGPSKRARTDSASSSPVDTRESSVDQSPIQVYIISAKLLPVALEDLVNLVENNATSQRDRAGACNLELTLDLDHADVVVTAVHTRPRLERHVRWEVAKTKAVVTPDWLRDSVNSGNIQPCGKYAALGELRDETESLCPKVNTGTPVAPEASPSSAYGQSPVDTDPEGCTNDTDLAALNYLSHFCCQRPSQLTCLNQALVKELDIIRRARFVEGEERSMLSYARAIAVSFPILPCKSITSREDIAKLPYLGTKLTSMARQRLLHISCLNLNALLQVEEFIQTGKIQEAQKFVASTRFMSLSTFTSVHGIGPHTARHLYSLGLRSIEDLEKYYEVTPGTTREGILLEGSISQELGVEKSIQVSLALRHDFSQKIPRREVEEINQVIMRELESIEVGCKSIIAGGYRRGKLESNDVDIVISHTDWDRGADKVRGLCKKLVQRLQERGLVTHVLNMSGYHPRNVFRTHHWDSLEKALTVFVLPPDSARKQTYRRVDLIFATPAVFWTAVVGWTGSTMFERDLRLWAKQAKHGSSFVENEISADMLYFRGLKFDSSGITRRHDSKPFHPRSERDVFELLGLAYVHPTLRNADA